MNPSNIIPHSLESEQSVIGAILLDESCRNKVVAKIKPCHFYDRQLMTIYTLFCEMFARKEHIDEITLSEYIKRKDQDNDLFTYLVELVKNVPSSVGVLSYCDTMIDRWNGRMIRAAAHDAILSIEGGDDYQKTRKSLYDDLEKLFKDSGDNSIADGEALAHEFTDELERLLQTKGGLSGWSTGDKHLDEVTGGLKPGDYIACAGRSGSGKTTRALNWARHFMQNNRRILIFSMEMKKPIIVMKMISDLSSVPFNLLKSANLDDEHWAKVSNGLNEIKNSKLHIDDSSGLSIDDIERKAKQLKAKYGHLDMIVIDYIQRLKIDSNNRYSETTEASNRLKDLFMELNCCGVVLAQLKKNSMGIPNASDLRETGAIENDSDTLIFLHTDSQDAKPHAGMMTLQVFNKVRLGETGIKLLHNDLKHQRFMPVDGEYQEKEESRF